MVDTEFALGAPVRVTEPKTGVSLDGRLIGFPEDRFLVRFEFERRGLTFTMNVPREWVTERGGV